MEKWKAQADAKTPRCPEGGYSMQADEGIVGSFPSSELETRR